MNPTPKPAPISLEHHEQALADACEEMRRTTAERCAEIAGGLYAPSIVVAIRQEFGLPRAPAPPPRRLKPRITVDPRVFEEDEEGK